MSAINGFVIKGKDLAVSSFSDSLIFFNNNFNNSKILLLIIPILIGLYLFFRKDVFKNNIDKIFNRRKNILFITRAIILVLLFIALAGPFVEKLSIVHGDPKIKILIDNSTSMVLFDNSEFSRLKQNLEQHIPVEINYIASGDKSGLSDGIISSMRPYDQVLLFSDGNNNVGSVMGDAALHAVNTGGTINALKLTPNKFDASVAVLGPDKTTSGAEEDYIISIKRTDKDKSINIKIEIDGEIALDSSISKEQTVIKRRFSEGYHTIHAKIESDDYFLLNNEFFKTVKVVPRPKVLVISKSADDLLTLFNSLYEISVVDKLPETIEELKPFTAVVIDNIEASSLDSNVNVLADFVSEGNGLYVIGGGNSFDSGNYKGSRIEQLLPVYISQAGKKRGEINIVIVIDKSASTGHRFGNNFKVDVEKALAISIIKSLSLVNNVGVVAFDSNSYLISGIKPMMEQGALEDIIARIKYSGNTHISQGLLKAVELLSERGGSKNIILISDGRNQDEQDALNVAQLASSQGIRIYTIGVGEDTWADNMVSLADIGNGAYFEPEAADSMKILFGDTESIGDKKTWTLVPINKNHFITQGIELTSSVYGFNHFIPKTSANLLVTTDSGDPIVSSWRFGLGRVVVLGSDYNLWGFELLEKGGSTLLTRSVNWAVGDPERKNDDFVLISDGRINEPISIFVKSPSQPKSEAVALYKIDEDVYSGEIIVTNVGFNSILGSAFGVNYNKEYQDIGFSNELQNQVLSTGGKMFYSSEVSAIVEQVKQKSKREVVIRKSLAWIFALTALLIYLGEVAYRRITMRKYL